MDKGLQSNPEINLREDTDLTIVLSELDVSMAEQQTGTLFLFRCSAGLSYFCPIVLILGY